MCNRIVQNKLVRYPGEPLVVVMRGPGGDWLMPLDGIWSGSAQSEKPGYWLRAMHGVEVLIPGVTRIGEVDEDAGRDSWQELPDAMALRGILLPEQTKKFGGGTYRLLKLMTGQATGDLTGKFEKDRAPLWTPMPPAAPLIIFPDRPPRPFRPEKPTRGKLPPRALQGELF